MELNENVFFRSNNIYQNAHLLQPSLWRKRVCWKHKQAPVLAHCCIFLDLWKRKKTIWLIMVENDEGTSDKIPKTLFLVWFAKALCFLKIPVCRKLFSELDNMQSKYQCCTCPRKGQEYFIVQYFKILSQGKIKMDIIDSVNNCIRLEWHRTTGEIGHPYCAREFGLVLVETIKGGFPTVWKNASILLVNGNDIQ